VPLPDARELLFRHPGSRIRHGEARGVTVALDQHPNGAARRRELRGVVEQVRQDLQDAPAITTEPKLLARVNIERKPLLRRQGSEELEALLQQTAHVVDAGLDRKLSGLEAPEVE